LPFWSTIVTAPSINSGPFGRTRIVTLLIQVALSLTGRMVSRVCRLPQESATSLTGWARLERRSAPRVAVPFASRCPRRLGERPPGCGGINSRAPSKAGTRHVAAPDGRSQPTLWRQTRPHAFCLVRSGRHPEAKKSLPPRAPA
jgi:hypothetical protein